VTARSVPMWIPLTLLVVLMLAVGGYTGSQSSAFLSDFNLNSLLLSAMPLAFAALGQTHALLVGGFDISVGAVIIIVLVAGSFLLTSTASDLELALGIAALIGIGVGVVSSMPR
jgi:ribose transport system ATP-binding protein